MNKIPLEEAANFLRIECKRVEDQIRQIKSSRLSSIGTLEQEGEVIANLTLAIRHIEDARMRLGKAIQYSGDGVSIYDK